MSAGTPCGTPIPNRDIWICEQCPRDKESRFDTSSEELLLNKPSTLEDSLHRASKYMEMEEEKKAFAEKHATISKDDEED
ncbi:hypothetical protein F2Q68_00008385 [Brassica cretica]|uniref:Uncharacterized protein n=1 Tax=Brassica cretica TaxID=69181 RepID=A0A8S9L1K5_BRACR|nr:hypothetical protein F2Q68_00008385 [Brassica cretica]